MLLGVAEQHVPVLRNDDPEVAAPALLCCQHQDASRVDSKPSRVLTGVLPHRLRDGPEQCRAALDQIGKCGARQMHPLTFEDLLLPMQGQVVGELLRDHVSDQPRPRNRTRDGSLRKLCDSDG